MLSMSLNYSQKAEYVRHTFKTIKKHTVPFWVRAVNSLKFLGPPNHISSIPLFGDLGSGSHSLVWSWLHQGDRRLEEKGPMASEVQWLQRVRVKSLEEEQEGEGGQERKEGREGSLTVLQQVLPSPPSVSERPVVV